ncbi:FtsK/SpoIIIE family DNA translocase [Endomicrobium proavitum]|uniref:Cell division protein FtsK n=1 Tax=Endomicrobium proavitum TaxID=1408281 RepID=A0A0G3WJD4_9BACT|nr:DNA translocase FtsK [Endomicrobium proavitum]AKL97957.1 Cell division protein FtsK [Endomicrobium proavitum]
MGKKKKNNKKSKNENKRKKQNHQDRNREVSALFFILASFIAAFLCVVPQNAGIIGRAFNNIFVNGIFGSATYILPFILLWYFIIHIKKSAELKERTDFIWSVALLIFGSLAFEAASVLFAAANVSGGWIGKTFYPFFKELFGEAFGFAVIVILFLFFTARLLRICISKVVYNFLKNIKEDIKKRKEEKEAAALKAPKIFENKSGLLPEIKKLEPFVPNIVNKQKKENSAAEKQATPSEPQKPQVKLDSKSFDYKFPHSTILKNDETKSFHTNKDELLRRAELLRSTLADFGIPAEVKDIIPGPVVTRYDLILAPGIKIQSVTNIIENISLTMRTASIRVVPIPEKAAVGVEVPNPDSVTVGLRGIVEHSSFINSKSLLTLALGKTTDGEGYVTNLASMPHLLIAGATGSGKSVGIHTIILSVLFKARPDEVKFMIIDPKRVEMPIYKDIPHLYNPSTSAADADIITNPREAASALKKLVTVMEGRYTKFAAATVRNIEEYNAKMSETGGEKEFYIVVVIDELADLMLVAKKEIEDSIQRLAQMARAVGIHLILATQRPSVNVITGIIKANFPARLSFQTTSAIDSRVILDMLGAENLMGKGDMLFLPPGEARPVRLQGAFVSLKEAQKIIDFINDQNFPRIYEPLAVAAEVSSGFNAAEEKSMKDLLPALKLINERRRVSQDLLKANFGSSARATNILSILEMKGFITKPEGTNKWQINYDKIEEYIRTA